MRRKFLAFSLALATALSMGICIPQVLAAEKQTVNEAVDMEADTKMPIIKDDTGTITEEMKVHLLANFEQQHPNTDLSDFTVEYSSDDDFNYDNINSDFLFKVYYKGVLIYDQFESNSRVFLGIRGGEDYEAVFEPEFAEACKSLNFNDLIEEESAKQVLKDAHKLSDSDSCDTQLVIYNYLTGMMGSDKAILAYKIKLTGNHSDVEHIIDAHSGEIIQSESSVIPTQDRKYKINEVTYVIHSDWAEVESCEVTVQGGKVVIPEEIDGVPVTKIGTAAFNGCVIQEIVIPEIVVEIGNSAFEGCYPLETVKLPSNLKKIEDSTFRSSGIKKIIIPESVTEIEETAFDGCSNLETITIPKNVKTIGKCVFSHSRLKEILVEEGNTDFSSVDGVLFNYDKTELIAYPGGKEETSYCIPNSVKTISGGTFGGAFAGSLNLTEVNIPEGVEIIESNAFSICPKLSELKLPSTVQKLEEKAINTCLSLSAVYIPKSVTEIGEGVFGKCDALTNIYYEGSETEWNELVSKSNLHVEATVSYNSYGTELKLLGDVNLDGEVTVSDVVMLQKWLVKSGDLTCWQNADLCEDGKINVFDLCLLKRKVMENMQSYPVKNPEVIDEFTPCTATLDDDFDDWMIVVKIKHQYSVPERVWTADDFTCIENIKSIHQYETSSPYRQYLTIGLSECSKENVLKLIHDIEALNLAEIKEIKTVKHGLGVPPEDEFDEEEFNKFFENTAEI